MPTCSAPVEHDRILLVVEVSDPAPNSGRTGRFQALVDTGATRCGVTRKVAEHLQIPSIGRDIYTTASGAVEETDVFRLRVDIPIGDRVRQPDGAVQEVTSLRGAEREVLLLSDDTAGHDVLLGMDFLNMFHITIIGGRFFLST